MATDPIADILRSLRLESALVARAECAGAWGVDSPALPCALFHAVTEGDAHFRSGDIELELKQGDVLVISRGDAHVLSNDARTDARPYKSFPTSQTGPIPTLHAGQEGVRTSLLCGSFTLRHAAATHFTSLMPSVIHISPTDPGAVPWLSDSVGLLLESLAEGAGGVDTVRTRILEAFFVHLLRNYFDRAEGEHGWLGALTDSRIAKALALIHSDASEAWSAADLASQVGMSRSSFFSRFSELVGEPPAQYVTRWRMLAAADLLRESPGSVAEIADQVGYGSEHAFARAFRRVIGATPGEYRRGADA